MNLTKLQKFVNLALNNKNENEARVAAKQLFSRLEKLGIKFKPSLFNLTVTEGVRIYNLSGTAPGVKPEVKPEPVKKEVNREINPQNRPHTLAQIIESIHKLHGEVEIPAAKARATLRRKMPFYPGTKFTDEEACLALEILVKHFCK